MQWGISSAIQSGLTNRHQSHSIYIIPSKQVRRHDECGAKHICARQNNTSGIYIVCFWCRLSDTKVYVYITISYSKAYGGRDPCWHSFGLIGHDCMVLECVVNGAGRLGVLVCVCVCVKVDFAFQFQINPTGETNRSGSVQTMRNMTQRFSKVQCSLYSAIKFKTIFRKIIVVLCVTWCKQTMV